jgi:hypothetical protein
LCCSRRAGSEAKIRGGTAPGWAESYACGGRHEFQLDLATEAARQPMIEASSGDSVELNLFADLFLCLLALVEQLDHLHFFEALA